MCSASYRTLTGWNYVPAAPFPAEGHRELEQYQGSPNPCVVFIIDDIDYSGRGSVGTLYVLHPIDVLRAMCSSGQLLVGSGLITRTHLDNSPTE
jgi:hypothetical protein